MSAFGSSLRLRIAAFGIAAAFAVLIVRAGHVALIAETEPAAREPEIAVAQLRRGDIVDRNGERLATTLAAYSLFADPQHVWDPVETARSLAGVLPELDVDAIVARLSSRRRFVWIERGLTPRQRQAVFALGLPGLDFIVEPRRVYPRGRLGAHVLGFTTIDGEGAAGAERAFDAELAGRGDEPLALSLDLRVQHVVDDVLRRAMETYSARAAAGLVVDIHSGEILALASLPDFDPNAPSEAGEDARLNRAIGGVYELGSIFKTFTVAMALDAGVADLQSVLPTSRPLPAGNSFVGGPHGLGRDLTVLETFVRSNNVGAGYLSLEAGEDTQRNYLERFGLLHRAPVEFAASARPIVPDHWDEYTRASMGFGYGVAVSPVAFMAGFAAVTNGGDYVRPTLRPRTVGSALRERVLSRETSAAMVQALRLVVTDGTGRRADVPGYGVAGKTGTAERHAAGGYDHDAVISSFAAVFPFHDPRYAVLVTLDEPHGTPETAGHAGAGYTAAPTVAQVIARAAPMLGVTPRSDDPRVVALREAG